MWQVRLLGGFQVSNGDQVFRHFRTRATDAVFAYLALHLGKPVRRETLLEIGWPDAERASGQQSLRMALSSLRKALGEVGFHADREVVSLHPDHFSTDVSAFLATRDPDLYTGRLLEGMDEAWIVHHASNLEETYFQAVQQAMEVATPEEAQRLAEAALRIDPSRLDLRAKLVQDVALRPAPMVLTSFVGRKAEIEEILSLLREERLVTLTGLGGSGKTRIAAEIWRRRQPDAWFVRLADVDDPSHLPEAIRQGLHLLARSTSTATELVIEALRTEAGLLVLDNFEHLLASAQLIETLLSECPGVHVLVTSQAPLSLEGEREVPIGPLLVDDCVQLFQERAGAVVPGFKIHPGNAKAVSELCTRLDGFPLALEIAAAKSRVFSPAEMLSQLDDRLEFLTKSNQRRGRHQSLRAALDWGFDRLSEQDQDLLARLTVFRGGFTLQAVKEVCGLPRPEASIDTLLAHSWVDRVGLGEPTRFRLLESVRTFASEYLSPRQNEALAASHARYYAQLAFDCYPMAFRPEEDDFHRRVEVDLHNVDAAWTWCKANDPESALFIVQALNWFYILRGEAPLAEMRMLETLALADQTPRGRLASCLHHMGNFLLFQGRLEESEGWFWKAHTMALQVTDSLVHGLSVCQIARVHAELGKFESAVYYANDSIRWLGDLADDNWLSAAYTIVALVNNRQGEGVAAKEAAMEAVRLGERGGYPWGIASALNELAMAYHLIGDELQSIRAQDESIEIKRSINAPVSLALSLVDRAASLLALGEVAEASVSLKEASELVCGVGTPAAVPRLFGVVGESFATLGRFEHASLALGTLLETTNARVLTFAERESVTNLMALGVVPESADVATVCSLIATL